jgi:repressor LexA
MNGLTDRQVEVIDLMVAHFEANGTWPTTRELGELIGGGKAISNNGVACHLRALIGKGFVEHEPVRSRGYRVIRLADGRRVEPRLVPVADVMEGGTQ